MRGSGTSDGTADAGTRGAATTDSPSPGAHRNLDRIFDDVLDHSVSLFEADKAGLWTVDDGDHPFRLAAHRGLEPTLLAAIADVERGSRTAGWRAVTEGRTVVLTHPWPTGTPSELVASYDEEGFRTVCLVPVAYLDEPLGLLALYHTRSYDWTTEELDLVESFADQAAVALQNARLYASVRALAARLDAIQDLAARWPTCRSSRSTSSRSIGRSWRAWRSHRPTSRSCARSWALPRPSGWP